MASFLTMLLHFVAGCLARCTRRRRNICSRLRFVDGGEQTLDGHGINDSYFNIEALIFEIYLQ
jgi:hypothetical protein